VPGREDLRAASAIGAVVGLSGFRRRESGPEFQDRREFVVVPLGGREVGDADADVVDESGLGHLLLQPTSAVRIAAVLASLQYPNSPRAADRRISPAGTIPRVPARDRKLASIAPRVSRLRARAGAARRALDADPSTGARRWSKAFACSGYRCSAQGRTVKAGIALLTGAAPEIARHARSQRERA
jgi:hypothetical protein